MMAKYLQAIIMTGVNFPRKTKKRLTPSVSARAQRKTQRKKYGRQVSLVRTETALASQKKALKTAMH